MTTKTTGTREHVDAMAHLAAIGKADDYTEGEYLEAVHATAFDRLLDEAGAFPELDGDVVTPDLLKRRTNEILVEQGYDITQDPLPSGQLPGVPESIVREALEQAIEELGRVGEKRRDALAVALGRRERIVDEAITARKIPASERDYWVGAIEHNDDLKNVLGTLPANPTIARFSATTDDGEHVTLPDDLGLEMHVRAEAWLEEAGRATRAPITGELEYDSKSYLVGLKRVREEMVSERTEADLKARGVKEAEWYADGRETTVYAEARKTAELQIDGRKS